MAGKLSFAVAINLLTDNFKKGANTVKGGLRSMQMQVLTFAAALGFGGVSLSNLVSKLIDTARETSRVTTALKNVSGSAGQFADSQRYLLDLAKKYGLEINALTGNFARFTASASMAGMSMLDQRKIFDSVSRSITAFGLSASEGDGVMMALSQMMSKGKISSEELRLQMGEKLPIALQAMAKAAGTTVGGLDDLMKKGKLLSTDVLPKFAEVLKEMTPNIDTDNLETSINKLKNTFTALTGDLGASDKYKSLVDGLTSLLQSAADNLKGLFVLILAAIAFVVTNGAKKIWAGWASTYDKLAIGAQQAQAAAQRATERRVASETTLAMKQRAEKIAEAEYEVALANGVAVEVLKAEQSKLRATQARVNAEKGLEKSKLAEQIAIDKASIVSKKTAALQSSTGWTRSFNVIKLSATKLFLSIKAMWSAFAPALIISGLVAIVGYFKNLYDESKRVKNIFSDYKKELTNLDNTAEVKTLEKQLSIMNDKTRSQEEINAAQSALQKMLGKEKLSQEEINGEVKKRIELLKASARADFAARKAVETENKIRDKESSIGLTEGKLTQIAKLKSNPDTQAEYWNELNKAITKDGKAIPLKQIRNINKAVAETVEDLKVLADADKQLEGATIRTNNINGGGDPEPNKEFEKAQERYAKSLAELDAKLKLKIIKESEYNKAFDELNKSALVEATAMKDSSVQRSEYFKKLQAAVAKPKYNKSQAEFESIEKNYNDELKKLSNQLASGAITQKKHDEELKNLAEKTALAAGAIGSTGIEKIDTEINAFIAALKLKAKMLTSSEKIKPKERDNTFDYKKTKADIYGEELKIAEDYRDKLKEAVKGGAVELQKELDTAMSNTKSLSDALKIAQVKEDIKSLEKELNEGLYSGMKNIASSSDRVVSAFKSVKDVFNDVDASGWERIMAVWNALTNTIDSFLSIIKMIETLTEVTNKLAKAKEVEAAIDTTTTTIKAANAATETATELTALTTQTTAEVAASSTKSTAASVEMAAKSTAAYAGIPFAGVGLAAAQIAAMQAMIMASSIPKFANGGIFGGGSYVGDNMLARVNSGEMILNHGQQSKLFKAIDSGRLGGASNVHVSGESRIKGDDIYLSMHNYMKKTGKRLPR